MDKFFECLNRLSNIKRYSCYRVHKQQSPAEHSFNVAMIAMYIADSDWKERKVNYDVLLRKALLHDFPEGLTGDIPSPTKNFSPTIKSEIKKIEKEVMYSIFTNLEYHKFYQTIINKSKEGLEGELIIMADLIDRLMYLAQEKESGNRICPTQYADTEFSLYTEKSQIMNRWPTAKKLVNHYLSIIKED